MSKKQRYYFIGISFISMITCVSIIPLHTSYDDYAVEEESSVSYERAVKRTGDDRGFEEIAKEEEEGSVEITSFSIGGYNIEESIAGMSIQAIEATESEDIKERDSNYGWTTSRVNLRVKTSTSSDVILTLDKQTKVEVISSTGVWSKVNHEDSKGYIYSKYLRDSELPSSDFTKEEIKILQRITEAECTGQSIESKENVASAIINRILSSDFPDTIKGVVFQKSQFSPISDGRYYSIEVTEDTIKAVDNVLENGVNHEGLFFCNLRDVKSLGKKSWFKQLSFLFKDDSNHSYYK